jgi:hypothetical protein
MQAGLPPIMQLDETGTVMLEPPKQQIKGTPSSEFMDVYYAGGGALPTMDQIAAREKMQQRPSQEGGGERFQLWDTGAGPQRFGTKSGKLEPIPGYEGVLRATQDPNVQAAKAAAQTTAKGDAGTDVKRRELYPKMKNRLVTFETQQDLLEKTIQETIDMVGPFNSGISAYLASLPETEARFIAGKLDTIKANIGIDTLQEVRENSPTGGAFGNMSDREGERTESTKAKLDQSLNHKDLKANLKIILEDSKKRRKNLKKAFDDDWSKYSGMEKTEKQEVEDPLGIR